MTAVLSSYLCVCGSQESEVTGVQIGGQESEVTLY